jgi:hypothetical protein
MPTIPTYKPSDLFLLTREFLETYPLYREFKPPNIVRLDMLKYSPSISAECPACEREQTFNFKDFDNREWMKYAMSPDGVKPDMYAGKTIKVNYECKGCNQFEMVFTVGFSGDGRKLRKIGQYPAYGVRVDSDTRAILGDHLSNYKKGRILESQAYGIGAFAYYRRIIDDILVDLLSSVSALISEEDKGDFERAIEAVVASKTAEDKIRIAVDLLPASMKPNGNNPLKLLYEILSVGIHGLSDEECLALSIDLRKNLEAFVHLLNSNRNAVQTLSESTKKLLQRKVELLKDKSKLPNGDY